ncbi:hypothetical protein [Legionella impletisoli]|uniref:Uncharacterized protein n=1 Tax=Legionella impletisoli TaxID=343510 RepID=A0A917JPR4_9GAMM|nr:hypothetical protein [Legionella impletisoli]GGI80777.1 hypothetical protein GCM10007966_06630 [Legionella impletisoli]
MDIKNYLVILTVLSFALANSFAFAVEHDKKEVVATFKTEEGKEIRCLVHQDDKKIAETMQQGAILQLISDPLIFEWDPRGRWTE